MKEIRLERMVLRRGVFIRGRYYNSPSLQRYVGSVVEVVCHPDEPGSVAVEIDLGAIIHLTVPSVAEGEPGSVPQARHDDEDGQMVWSHIIDCDSYRDCIHSEACICSPASETGEPHDWEPEIQLCRDHMTGIAAATCLSYESADSARIRPRGKAARRVKPQREVAHV